MNAPKVFVIALDGATFDLIEPWAAAGHLPHLQKLIANGAYARLESTPAPDHRGCLDELPDGSPAGTPRHLRLAGPQRRKLRSGADQLAVYSERSPVGVSQSGTASASA
jgi:predicted AlkP superfamily phosphohydrolase/phosphomutase